MEVNSEIDVDKFVALARKKKAAVYTVERCFLDKEKAPKNLLLLGFGRIDEKGIKRGVEVLKLAMEQCLE